MTEQDCDLDPRHKDALDSCALPQNRERVGPGHPPARARFKRGQSGNPGGRPKRKEIVAYILRRTQNLTGPINMLDSISRGCPITIPGRKAALIPNLKDITRACEILIEHGAGKAPVRVLQPIQDQRSMTVVLSQPPGFDPLAQKTPATPNPPSRDEIVNGTHVIIEDV